MGLWNVEGFRIVVGELVQVVAVDVVMLKCDRGHLQVVEIVVEVICATAGTQPLLKCVWTKAKELDAFFPAKPHEKRSFGLIAE